MQTINVTEHNKTHDRGVENNGDINDDFKGELCFF